jgi:DNA repair protein SbcC/Rad50
MLRNVEIHNFLSHKNTIVHFVSGVNVIVGLSDSGKSAIINALRWVIFNQPMGESFRSWWGGSTWVKVTTDKYEITRLRNDTENGYILQSLKKDSVKSRFNAIKNGVPEEITRALNITDVNFQRQVDTHFLLSETPGEVAKYFNKIAKLDSIDTATTNINSWINELNRTIKYKETDLEKNKEKLSTFNFVEELETQVEVLEILQSQLEKTRNRKEKLLNVYTQLVNGSKSIAKKEKEIEIEPLINSIITNIERRNLINNKKDLIANWFVDYKEVNSAIIESTMFLKSEKLVDTLIKVKKVNSIIYM